jgi:guanine deaminase
MASLGDLVAEDPSLHLQTHLSENTAEIKETLGLFPDCESYTAVYDKYGMLRKGTILAHCVWLSPAEMKVISDRHAGISHCPTSNFNLMSGGARVGAMLDEGIEVGLGSDCGGGFAIGILSQIRDASKLSKMIALNASTSESSKKRKYSDKPLSIPALFHMATLGGASICNLKDKVGNFEAGKEFDALRVTPGASPGFFLDVGEDTTTTSGSKSRQERVEVLKRNFERFLFVSDDRDIADVWVQGRRVAGSRP